jgi:hypothetical protein
MKNWLYELLKKTSAVPHAVSILTLLCAFVLAALQFTRIFTLNPQEEGALTLLLLTLIGGSFLFEHHIILKKILKKLDKLEKHYNVHKPESVSEKNEPLEAKK